jgi:hypothetical protein
VRPPPASDARACASATQVIVFTRQAALNEALRINRFTHDNKIAFIYATTNGLFGCVVRRLRLSGRPLAHER